MMDTRRYPDERNDPAVDREPALDMMDPTYSSFFGDTHVEWQPELEIQFRCCSSGCFENSMSESVERVGMKLSVRLFCWTE